MRTLYLTRHGMTEWNADKRWQGQTDIPLCDEGRAQARALAGRLAGRGLVRVHTSDLARARETAEIVAAELGLGEVVPDPDLRERCFGPFEGKTAEECAAELGEVWQRYLADRRCLPEGAEPDSSVSSRMVRAVERAAAALADAGGSALLVSHGAALRSLLTRLGGTPFPPIPNGALFRLVLEEGRMPVCEALVP
jgi:probable phosphoglycerate mutase